MTPVPIYYKSGRAAYQAGELDQYRASMHANVDTRAAIDKAISEHFDGMHLDPAALSEVLNAHDPARVALVLSMTILDRSHDGRLSSAARAWAPTIRIPDPDTDENGQPALYDSRTAYVCRSHTTILDGFIRMYMVWEAQAL